ncbi:MAG: hypothetical protein IJR87_07005 [Bacteroidaceae bacterium]|nr:hypothetical protein [Bacteroidaceae bacterium]
MLQDNALMVPGKNYPGLLRRDIPSDEFGFDDSHFTFIESVAPTAERRNVHVFKGSHITCSKRLDGSLRLNFKGLKLDADFSVDGYALEVANEIRQALTGLVERGK